MPSRSKPQAKLMAMVAHNPKMAKETGVPAKVAKEFNKADKKTGILRSRPEKQKNKPVATDRGKFKIKG